MCLALANGMMCAFLSQALKYPTHLPNGLSFLSLAGNNRHSDLKAKRSLIHKTGTSEGPELLCGGGFYKPYQTVKQALNCIVLNH